MIPAPIDKEIGVLIPHDEPGRAACSAGGERRRDELSDDARPAPIFLSNEGDHTMSFGRAVLCLIFPPLAVLDRGCGTVLIVAALSLVGWVPGVLAALYINIEYDRSP
jgi:uncharacterized membrane protein YqaE (UPF0057 family)